MGWVKKTPKPCIHQSRPILPDRVTSANMHMVGDIWECEECQVQFRVNTHKVREGGQIYEDVYTVTRFKWTTEPERLRGYLDR